MVKPNSSITDTSDVTVIWDTQVQTDQTIIVNKTDFIFEHKKQKLCLLKDVPILLHYNINHKEAEKEPNYHQHHFSPYSSTVGHKSPLNASTFFYSVDPVSNLCGCIQYHRTI